MNISKRVFGSNVSKTVRDYINYLQAGTFDIQPGEEVSVNFDTQTYIGDRTPYSRMWTSVTKVMVDWKEDPDDTTKKKWVEVSDRENFVYSINENKNEAYEELESLDVNNTQADFQYQGELKDNRFLKSSAGIKTISSKSEGSLGALRRTTVEFVVHNKNDFQYAEEQRKNLNLDCKLYLQPEWSKKNHMIPQIIEFVKSNKHWLISLQNHKYMNIP